MSKKKVITPIFRFKQDPVIALINDIISKKPVNSDHYSIIKRIKLSDYIKGSVTTDNLDSVGIRSKEYMNEVGFAYGRLQEKNWISGEIKEGTVRINAPGPLLNKLMHEEEEEEIADFNDEFQSKISARFQKVKVPQVDKNSPMNSMKTRGKTTQPATRITASQRQAREYLNYLQSLNPNENSYIHSQVSQKTKELEERFQVEAKKKEEKLNSLGMFSAKFNKERVNSMMPVKMNSQIKLTIEPISRNAKEIVMKERYKDWKYDPFSNSAAKTADTNKKDRKAKLMDVVERAISKKASKFKKKENFVMSAKKKVKMHWTDRLNQTMAEVIEKTRPDERISNMKVL